MVTLLPIEPLSQAHGALIVEAFSRLFINGGGQSDGWGNGDGPGFSLFGCACGYGYGWDNGNGDGNGNIIGDGDGGSLPEEWLVK